MVFPIIKSNYCLLETNNKKDDTEKEDSFVIPQVGIITMNSLVYILTECKKLFLTLERGFVIPQCVCPSPILFNILYLFKPCTTW